MVFLKKCSYPQCIGDLDATHIPIKPPLGRETDYFNYKKHHSVMMLTYVNVGTRGRSNDAFIFNRYIILEVIQNPIYANN